MKAAMAGLLQRVEQLVVCLPEGQQSFVEAGGAVCPAGRSD